MIIGFDASRAFVNKKTGTENYSYQLLQNLLKVDQTNKYNIYLPSWISMTEAKSKLVKLLPESGWRRREISSVDRSEVATSEDALEKQRRQDPRLELTKIPLPRLWTQLGLAARTFIDPLDVLFIPSHTLPLMRKPGLKTVVTVHDLGAQYLPQTHQLKQRLYLNLMTHYQLKSATHLIAVSKSTKDDLKKVGIDPKKITVVYEGYDEEKFKVQNSKFKIEQTLNTYSLIPNTYFLFVGTIQPRKNLARLIEAYATWLRRGDSEERSQNTPAAKLLRARKDFEIPRRQDPKQLTTLVLAGGMGWLADEIYRLPKQLGIEDKVKFLGYVPDEDLPALYSGAKAFLFPSLFEGFGLPVLEAMACGCPVLTSNVSSLPEVAGKAAILVNPYSVNSITCGIIQVATSKVAAQFVKKGFERVKKFSWEKAARETLKILESV